MKKLLSILLSTFLVFSIYTIIPIAAQARQSGCFKYDVWVDGTARITQYIPDEPYNEQNGRNVVIPSELDGYTVTIIAAYAFNEETIDSVFIPDTVTTIEQRAFYRCKNLKNVDFDYNYYTQQGVKTIGERAFCIQIEGYKRTASLQNVTIPPSVTSIGTCAFGYWHSKTWTDHPIEGWYEEWYYMSITGYNNTEAQRYANNNPEITFISLGDVPAAPAVKQITDCTVTLSQTEYTYDGSEKKPTVTVKDGSATLTAGTDYTLAYADNKNAGTATVTVTGTGGYTGSVNKNFTIGAKNLSSTTVTLTPSSYTYDGTAKKPAVTVKDGTKTLTSGTDYTVSYTNNTYVGTATVTVTGKGNYTGSINKQFTITSAPKKDISACTITLSQSSYSYDGTEKKPTVTVTEGAETLTSGTDYSVSYKNNINAGTAAVTVTGKGNYTGTGSKSFSINARTIAPAAVTLSQASYTYDGSAKKPTVTVKLGTKTLKKDTDYSVAYKSNTNAGTATVTVTGKGNYTDSVTKNFTISPKSISSATVILSQAYYAYDGTEKKPTVTVKDGSKRLTLNTDYTVSYSNNKAIGAATVTVSGKGNYKSSTSKNFTILETIAINSKKTVTIVMGGIEKYYAFQPNRDMIISFYSTGSYDTYGYLYNANLNQLSYTEEGGAGFNFKITYKLLSGKTYIFACGLVGQDSTGTFDVKLELNTDYDGTDEPDIPSDYSGLLHATVLGDADGDGEVSILDATAIQRTLAKLPTTGFNKDAADTDEDGEVTILDATSIQRWLVNLESPAGISDPIT